LSMIVSTVSRASIGFSCPLGIGRWSPLIALVFVALATIATSGLGQAPLDPLASETTPRVSDSEDTESSPSKVDVNPIARDDEIENRLLRILKATQWFRESRVTVQEGVVFLAGQTADQRYKEWAANLARNVQDVVAVVNQIEVDDPSIWDMSTVQAELSRMSRSLVRAIPVLAFSVIVLALAGFLARFISRGASELLRGPIETEFLRSVAANGIGMVLFILAIYLVLQVAGLTRLALTLAGGTGLIGLALGIAFKDITENFLASLYLSLRKPFEIGDLIEVTGVLGYVQRVTSRTTILMTLEGNHVQIPNAIIFKNTLRNFTSNPLRRVDFLLGLDYEASIGEAQTLAMQVLRDHPAVLNEPAPWVLVDAVEPGKVNLRIYFWLDGIEHSWLKVRSAVLRLLKRAFESEGINLAAGPPPSFFAPIEPTRPESETGLETEKPPIPTNDRLRPAEPMVSPAEDGLVNEAAEIEVQARSSRLPEAGANLISTAATGSTTENQA